MVGSLWDIPIFFAVVILFFTLPGVFLILKAKLDLTFWERVFIGSIVGLVLFTLTSYIFIVLNLFYLSLIPFLIIDFFVLRKFKKAVKGYHFKFNSQIILLILVFLVGIIGQLLVISPSGRLVNGNLIFWSSHGHDASWHIALMEDFPKGWPLQNPAFAGNRLVNYHYFSDIAPSVFEHYFALSPWDLYFRFFPFFYSLELGVVAFLFGRKMGNNFRTGLWSSIFVYFTGSFGYIVTWVQSHQIAGESVFGSSQIQSSIGNPPQAVSLILVLTFLYLFSFFINSKNRTLTFLCVLLAGTMMVFKVYAGVVVLTGLGIATFWQLLRERKIHLLSLFIPSAFLSSLLYFPNVSGNSSSFLILQPWWYIQTMVVTPDHLNWIDWEHKRQTYLADHNIKRVLQLEVEAFLIFFFGNLGMRLLGLWDFLKGLKKIFSDYLTQLLISVSIISFIFPLLFLQKGVAGNTIQFLQYFLLIFGIFAALTIDRLLNKIKPLFGKVIIALVIIFLSIPTQIGLLNTFYSRAAFAQISPSELSALEFIKLNTSDNSVILTPPFNKYLDAHQATPPIWAWSDSAYVAAITGRREYLADTEQVNIMGYNYQPRLNVEEGIFNESNPQIFTTEIKKTGVNYLYFPLLQKPKVDLNKTTLTPIFKNDASELWRIN